MYNWNHCKLYLEHKKLQTKHGGWTLYNAAREYARMGLQFTTQYRVIDNQGGRICPTYPLQIVVSASLTEQQIQALARFRSRQRMLSLSYSFSHPSLNKPVTLYRGGQPRCGPNKNRCPEDQQLVKSMGYSRVYDLREFDYAEGNMINNGMGYQLPEFYPDTDIKFMAIPNLFNIKPPFDTLKAECLKNDGNVSSLKQFLYACEWYQIVLLILAVAHMITQGMLSGRSAVLHCSDGWDRTPQVCALVQVSLDPYFRTFYGFAALVEKEFISFGHKSRDRLSLGMMNSENREESPIVTQFLDCVSQLLHAYPNEFQFNYAFLAQLAHLCHTNSFGTFLCDSELEQQNANIKNTTVSVWSYLKEHFEDRFKNSNYKPAAVNQHLTQEPKNIRLWSEYYFNLDQLPSRYPVNTEFIMEYQYQWTPNQPKTPVQNLITKNVRSAIS